MTSGRARVEAGFRAYFEFAVGDRSSFRLLFGTSIRSDVEELAATLFRREPNGGRAASDGHPLVLDFSGIS